MRVRVLKEAERVFIESYPGGFANPEMQEIARKHKFPALPDFARKAFTKKNFENPGLIVAEAGRLVSRSTVISMFEKPKFRGWIDGLESAQEDEMAATIYELLHGKPKAGFEAWVELLARNKLAKWPLATVIQSYYRPLKEPFVKPTTTKLIIECLGLDLEYKPKPTWDFYRKFRSEIAEMMKKTPKVNAPTLAAYTGFLMTTLKPE